MFYIDWTYILVIVGLLITVIASNRMKTTVAKYAKVQASCGLTGAQVAKKILSSNNIYGVSVQPIQGELTDHYDPRNQTVNLSQPVFNATSIAAIGVAAHECGHAIQADQGYFPLKFRSAIVPVVNIGSKLAWPVLIVGVFLGGLAQLQPGEYSLGRTLVDIGIFLYALAVFFQLVTLPVEYNASSRAVEQLDTLGIVGQDEKEDVRKVLNVAALTYVAAASSGLLQLLRVIFMFGGRGNRRR